MAALEQQKPQSAAAGSNAKMLLHGLFMPLLFSFGVWRAVVVVLWWLYYVWWNLAMHFKATGLPTHGVWFEWEAKNVDEVAYYQVSDASLLVLILIDGKLCTYVGGFYQNEIDLTLQTEI